MRNASREVATGLLSRSPSQARRQQEHSDRQRSDERQGCIFAGSDLQIAVGRIGQRQVIKKRVLKAKAQHKHRSVRRTTSSLVHEAFPHSYRMRERRQPPPRSRRSQLMNARSAPIPTMPGARIMGVRGAAV